MKSILVPAGGSASDGPVFHTALAAAQLFSSHLHFIHIRSSAGEAAVNNPHIAFAGGAALANALDELQATADGQSETARRNIREFCTRENLLVVEGPIASHCVTASWSEEYNQVSRQLLIHSRQNDLIVMGRTSQANGFPADLVEDLLLGSGRPILLTCSTPPRNLTGTIMVCWRETPDAARAVVAAMPFLSQAQRVVFAGVDEGHNKIADAVNQVASRFRWRGICTETRVLARKGLAVSEALSSAAEACAADLVVMGAYGHSRMRERILGGCTQAVVEHSDRPILLFH